jgi:ligand-binding sensor domain-containing protein/DNA-binding CsgD family transcriptional regulator
MRYIKINWLYTFCIITISSLFGQVKNIGLSDIRNYKKSDYKGGTQNWNIDQDKKGHLYFANNNGLFQFDGATWRKYSLPDSSSIRSLKVDLSGKIFVGGYNEFGYFKANEKGTLEYFSISKQINRKKIKIIDYIWKIHVLDGEVLFQSFNKLYVYKNNKLKFINPPKRFQFSFAIKNKIYIQDISQGILEYKTGKLFPLKGTSDLNTTEMWGMFDLPNNRLLISTLSKGLFIYENEKMTPWNTEANTFIKKNSSLGCTSIKNNFIVINSVLDGVIICDLQGNIIQHINHENGLQNNTVLCSFVDYKNNLWLGLDNGITFINEDSPFTYLGYSYALGTVYGSVLHNKNLYVATNQGVFYRPWNVVSKNEPFKLLEGTTSQTWSVQVIDNQLFCSNNRGALLVRNDKSIQTLDTKGYFCFRQMPNNANIIIGSNYNGFSVFEKIGTDWKLKNQIQGFDKTSISFEIDEKNIWIKKDNLIYKLVINDNLSNFKTIKTYSDLTNSNKGIGSIQRLKNKLYFQTKNHFFNYSQQKDLFVEDKKMSLLFEKIPKIHSVTEDSLGNLWYAYQESLGVLMKQKGEQYQNNITSFSSLTGNLVSNYTSINTIDSQNIFIGLTDGLAHFDASSSSNFAAKPVCYIRDFSFPDKTFILNNGQKTFDKLKLAYASNHVKFTFSSPTYENIENLVFSYQLDGFDKKWSNWSVNTIKEYTNLREGNYKMKIKVKNSYGIVSDATVLDFTVLPPWYRHFLAYILYLIAFIVAIYFVRERIKMKIRKHKYYETIEQRRLYLEKESKIKEEQLILEKEIERLEYEKLQVKILTKDKELVNNTLQVVNKNKVLNEIIYKLKDINTETLDESNKYQFTKINKSISKEVNTDKSWKDLEKHIKNVHFDFLKRLKAKYPTITPRELDLATYLLMNMSTKEISEIMNISGGGVELARYRLRKKLELTRKQNLIGFLMKV